MPNRPVALVAGASRGLGLLIARELGRRGHRLVICARDPEELKRAADRLRSEGVTVTTEITDVSDPDAVEALVARTEAGLGPIEVMVCVAGIIQVGPLASLRRKHFEEAVDVMLWGPVNTCLAVVPRMRQRGRGRIAVITSVGGLIAAPHLLPYTTAKFAAVGFTRGLRSELAGTGVTVTTVAPGLMRTGSHVRATFTGDQPREYAWFATAASAPLLTMSADRAATRIVSAVLRGRSFLTLTPLAWLAPRVDALFPRLTSSVLEVTARLLPDPPATDATPATVDGWQAATNLRPGRRLLLNRLTTLGRRAARRNLEQPLPAAVPPRGGRTPAKRTQ
jgi:NAD(P)-dependent dehydrogenase (short-subunit alcohol dehydrogenase family)